MTILIIGHTLMEIDVIYKIIFLNIYGLSIFLKKITDLVFNVKIIFRACSVCLVVTTNG